MIYTPDEITVIKRFVTDERSIVDLAPSTSSSDTAKVRDTKAAGGNPLALRRALREELHRTTPRKELSLEQNVIDSIACSDFVNLRRIIDTGQAPIHVLILIAAGAHLIKPKQIPFSDEDRQDLSGRALLNAEAMYRDLTGTNNGQECWEILKEVMDAKDRALKDRTVEVPLLTEFALGASEAQKLLRRFRKDLFGAAISQYVRSLTDHTQDSAPDLDQVNQLPRGLAPLFAPTDPSQYSVASDLPRGVESLFTPTSTRPTH